VITLAPPLFPLPLDEIAGRILQQFFPKGIQRNGFISKLVINSPI
jgi:hypothetical protein